MSYSRHNSLTNTQLSIYTQILICTTYILLLPSNNTLLKVLQVKKHFQNRPSHMKWTIYMSITGWEYFWGVGSNLTHDTHGRQWQISILYICVKYHRRNQHTQQSLVLNYHTIQINYNHQVYSLNPSEYQVTEYCCSSAANFPLAPLRDES